MDSSSMPGGHSEHHTTSQLQTSANGTGLSVEEPSFDIVAWYPFHQSCLRYFINHAQHSGVVQNVAAFVNIRLPFQWSQPIVTLNIPNNSSPNQHQPPQQQQHASGSATPASSSYFQSDSFYARASTTQPLSPSLPFVSLIPFIRRLIVTGFDTDPVMQGFFGSDWKKGVGPLQESERRNYMFAAKSVGWAKVKYQYDMSPDETVPFVKPLQRVQLAEIERSEKAWSEWLAMEDWMVGPRAPPEDAERPYTSGTDRRESHRDDMIQDP